MGRAKIEVGEVRGSWGLLERREEEVAFYERFVARHGGALARMGETEESYRLDFPPGTLHGSARAFFYFTQPGCLCARLRSTDAQPGHWHSCNKRAASAGMLLLLRTFLLVIIIQIIHRNAQELSSFRQCRTCWIIGGIIYHTASHTKRNICPSRELADAYIFLPQNLLHTQPKSHNDTSLLILFHDYRGKEKKNKSMCFSALDFLYSF
jgi:hypothetical protein